MSVISVQNLSKVFKVFKPKEGLRGAFLNLLSRKYENLYAVKNISFSLEQGEFVGYIGPNGAGKSTTVKMLTGILVPTSGEVRVVGLVPYENRNLHVRNIGVVFGQRTQLWWDLAVVESFNLLQKIYDVPKQDFDRRLERLKPVLGLDELLHVPVRKLSLGQRMKCDLAASLLHGPKVLFLDEPTIGLDVVTKAKVRQFLRQLNEEDRVTIILTTHDLQDIEELCERIMIIDHGELIFDGGLSRLRRQLGGQKIINFEFTRPTNLNEIKRVVPNGKVEWSMLDEVTVRARFDTGMISSAAIVREVINSLPLHDMTIEEPPIEEIVKTIYEKGVADLG